MVRPELHRALPVREPPAGPGDDGRVLPDADQHPEATFQRRRDDGQGRTRAEGLTRLRALHQHPHPVLPRPLLHVQNQVIF